MGVKDKRYIQQVAKYGQTDVHIFFSFVLKSHGFVRVLIWNWGSLSWGTLSCNIKCLLYPFEVLLIDHMLHETINNYINWTQINFTCSHTKNQSLPADSNSTYLIYISCMLQKNIIFKCIGHFHQSLFLNLLMKLVNLFGRKHFIKKFISVSPLSC